MPDAFTCKQYSWLPYHANFMIFLYNIMSSGPSCGKKRHQNVSSLPLSCGSHILFGDLQEEKLIPFLSESLLTVSFCYFFFTDDKRVQEDYCPLWATVKLLQQGQVAIREATRRNFSCCGWTKNRKKKQDGTRSVNAIGSIPLNQNQKRNSKPMVSLYYFVMVLLISLWLDAYIKG